MPSSSPCIDFELSGAGESAAGPITLKDVQQTCVDLGFVKKDVGDTKPLAQRANVADFFKALGVTSLSGFKARFYGEKLPQPYVGQAPLVAEKDKPKEEVITWKVPPVADYDTLAAEWTEKKWRMLPKPGGAVMKPEDWYCIWGAQQQVEKGDNPDEKPMWAHHGGLDFDGRERWEKWDACKCKLGDLASWKNLGDPVDQGLTTDAAKLKFVQAYGKAMAEERTKTNFRAY